MRNGIITSLSVHASMELFEHSSHLQLGRMKFKEAVKTIILTTLFHT